ncbi:hypothetical protein D3C80_1895050 [compost metagenome]
MAQRIEASIYAKLGNSASGIGLEDNRASARDAWFGTWIDSSGRKARQVIGEVPKPHGLVIARLRRYGGVGQ